MILNENNFYHPFEQSMLGFLLNDQGDVSNSTTGLVIDDIDLYYQPLEHPLVVISFFVLKLIVILIGERIGFKLILMIKKDRGILRSITLLFIVIQMVLWPLGILFDLIVNLVHPVTEVIGKWFCSGGWLLSNLGPFYVFNYSFCVAVMRYVFLVHEEWVWKYGKEKVKWRFLCTIIAMSSIQTLIKAVSGTSRASVINKCYGYHHKVFLVETSTLRVLQRKFWDTRDDSPLMFVDGFIYIFKNILKIVEAMLFLVMGFNISEGFIYRRLFSHLTR